MNIFRKDNNGAELKYTVSCPRCPWKMEALPFLPVVGGGFDPRLAGYIDTLKKHIERTHPDVGMQIGAFSAFLVAAAFKLEDPLLLQMKNDLRRALHFQTRPTEVTDEQIDERVSRIEEFDGQQQEAVASLLKDMRDVLTEQGKYAPKQPVVESVTV